MTKPTEKRCDYQQIIHLFTYCTHKSTSDKLRGADLQVRPLALQSMKCVYTHISQRTNTIRSEQSQPYSTLTSTMVCLVYFLLKVQDWPNLDGEW